jgi:uncharacterized membrane protein required for colicin V production
MMNIVYIFWMYVVIFAVIGAARGWAKELLVSFSVILALALNHALRRYIPWAENRPDNDITLFWMQTLILLALVFFGYQTVVSIPHLAARAARERVQDTIVGGFVGGLNGYLIAGTILYYIHMAEYPFKNIIQPPTDPAVINTFNQMISRMPPHLLGDPGIYFAIILAFIFVLIVYI